MQQNK